MYSLPTDSIFVILHFKAWWIHSQFILLHVLESQDMSLGSHLPFELQQEYHVDKDKIFHAVGGS